MFTFPVRVLEHTRAQVCTHTCTPWCRRAPSPLLHLSHSSCSDINTIIPFSGRRDGMPIFRRGEKGGRGQTELDTAERVKDTAEPENITASGRLSHTRNTLVRLLLVWFHAPVSKTRSQSNFLFSCLSAPHQHQNHCHQNRTFCSNVFLYVSNVRLMKQE